jgi:hypothetical protein
MPNQKSHRCLMTIQISVMPNYAVNCGYSIAKDAMPQPYLKKHITLVGKGPRNGK